jgi:DNA invertase Pin-like site-specific DNA recombinase
MLAGGGPNSVEERAPFFSEDYSERTFAGVKAAQRRGVKFGRKRKPTPEQIDHARKLIDYDGESCQHVAALFNVNRTTLYRALAA